jgi:predicted nucleic acid-binding protein
MTSRIDRPVVLDTGVIVDIFVKNRTRHDDAKRLAEFLIRRDIPVRAPMHALFELTAAIRQTVMNGPVRGNEGITEVHPLRIEYVTMDLPFFNRYFDPSIPYLKAGDLVVVCLAKGDNAILISEDDRQYAAAEASGVEVYRIAAFLERCVK